MPNNFDLVEAMTEYRAVDVVDRIYRSNHERYCNYKPYINPVGVIYCMTCDSTIDSLSDDPAGWNHRQKARIYG